MKTCSTVSRSPSEGRRQDVNVPNLFFDCIRREARSSPGDGRPEVGGGIDLAALLQVALETGGLVELGCRPDQAFCSSGAPHPASVTTEF